MTFKKSSESKVDTVKKAARKAMFLNTFVQLTDNKKAVIENCRHIVECNDIYVKVSTADFDIDVWGKDLTISDFNAEFVVINGTISSLEINPKGRSSADGI